MGVTLGGIEQCSEIARLSCDVIGIGSKQSTWIDRGGVNVGVILDEHGTFTALVGQRIDWRIRVLGGKKQCMPAP